MSPKHYNVEYLDDIKLEDLNPGDTIEASKGVCRLFGETQPMTYRIVEDPKVSFSKRKG